MPEHQLHSLFSLLCYIIIVAKEKAIIQIPQSYHTIPNLFSYQPTAPLITLLHLRRSLRRIHPRKIYESHISRLSFQISASSSSHPLVPPSHNVKNIKDHHTQRITNLLASIPNLLANLHKFHQQEEYQGAKISQGKRGHVGAG
jgi:hypothetical protein